MRPDLVQGESLVEFFRTLVDDALRHQGLRTLELTRYYIVQLLVARARVDLQSAGGTRVEEPLALWFARALEAGGARQRAELRSLADHALFVSGFFSDSLACQVVDIDYYASLGGHAYQQLSVLGSDTFAPTFAELGHGFLTFADILTEVSEHTALTSDENLLRLYERWVRHGSRRNVERLLRRGIAPTHQAVEARRLVQ
jgi:hypothetical protein